METSYWIKFFMDAGIPPSDSAHYAVLFADNRIAESMLMDLNKDYLNDMGISRLGDVIAILKNAKDVHKKIVEDRLLYSGNGNLSANTSRNNRRESPATRMIGHSLTTRKNQAVATQAALGGGTTRVNPERTISYEAPMPTARRNILVPEGLIGPSAPLLPATSDVPTVAAPSGTKTSVFDRLGDSTLENVPAISAKPKAEAESVFSRLGKKRPATDCNPPVPGIGTPLPYAGVLVASSTKKNKPHVPKPITVSKKPEADDGPSHPTSATEGILSRNASLPKCLKDRLGGKVISPADTTDTKRTNLKIVADNTPRLRGGSGHSEVSSSSDDKHKPSILHRLGTQL